MKKLSLIALSIFLLSTPLIAGQMSATTKGKIGKFPKIWRTWPFQRGKATKVYKLEENDGHRYIQAKDSEGLSPQIFYRFAWDLKKHPDFSWKWRPKQIPAGANEDDGNLNDSACGVYVIFGQYTGHAIKYVWSSTNPVDEVITRRNGKLKIKVLGTGGKGLNKWYKYKRSVIDDHKELFGEIPKKSSGIAILTDSNATHKTAACDYADFSISK